MVSGWPLGPHKPYGDLWKLASVGSFNFRTTLRVLPASYTGADNREPITSSST